MPNYKNSKIYKLWSPEGDDIYIGSTTESLARRKAKHKSNHNTSSKILFDKYTDVRIELLEECPCDNKEQLLKKEGEYIRNNNCVNKCVAGRTHNESVKNYYENNKEKILDYHKVYRTENKEEIKIKKSIKITCDCGRTINKDLISKHLKSKIHYDLMEELK